MVPPTPSITLLADLVDRVQTLIQGKESRLEDLLTQEGDPLAFELRGRPLAAWLSDLWPASGGWEGTRLSETSCAALHGDLRRRADKLERELSHKKFLARRAVRRLAAAAQEPEAKVTRAQQTEAQARAVVDRLGATLVRQEVEANQAQARMQGLQAWLEGITPQGFNGFRDAKGREITTEALRQAYRRFEELHRQWSQREQARHETELALGQADAALESLVEQSQQARLQREAVRQQVKHQTGRLRKAQQSLAAGDRRLEDLRQEVAQAASLRHFHTRLLGQAAGLLQAVFEEAGSLPSAALAESLAEAQRQGQRATRLAGLQLRLEKRLKPLSQKVPAQLKSLREINREITELEGSLPGMIKTLTHPDTAVPQARARAAAGLSSLLARVQDLMPQARAADLELEELRTRLQRELERARRWQEDWREAGRAERALLAQASALVEEVRLHAGHCRERRRETLEQLAPTVEALGGLCVLDLVPSLAGAVEQVLAWEERAAQQDAWVTETQDGLPAPSCPNLSKPPLAIKVYSAAHRRLSGKQVALSSLKALEGAAGQWQHLLSRPVVEGIEAPWRQLVENLSGGMRSLAIEHGRQLGQRGRAASRIRSLREKLSHETSQHHGAAEERDFLRQQTSAQSQRLTHLEAELSVARQDQAALKEVLVSLEETRQQADLLSRRLERSDKLAMGFKAKVLAHRKLLGGARKALEELAAWQAEAGRLETESTRLRQELIQARQEVEATQQRLAEMTAQRDQVGHTLAEEQAARARQALDFLEGQALSVELAATQGEASRWAALASDLARSLTLAGLAHQQEVADLHAQLESAASQGNMLNQQLGRIAQMVSSVDTAQAPPAPLMDAAPPPPPARETEPPLAESQVERVLDKLSAVRHSLRRLGRSTLGHGALIAALTSGLVLVAPSTPTKATLSSARLTHTPVPIVHLSQRLKQGPAFEVPVEVVHLAPPSGRGGLEVSLLPLGPARASLPQELKEQVAGLAKRAGLSPKVLLTSARALYGKQAAVETRELDELAETARSLARRHPLIFKELASTGLPASATALASLRESPEKAQHLFLDRLYREYRTLGFAPEEALGALAANERATQALGKAWTPPGRFRGKIRLVNSVEGLDLSSFMRKLSPYIKSRLEVFLRSRSMTYAGDLDRYAKNLAFDMYCAAKKFQVPVTFLLAIAHQETWYANVLGDANRSASPFQIYEPTKALIRLSMEKQGFAPPPAGLRLEHHLTMATYMAAFHLRELMQMAYMPPTSRRKACVDMDKVLLRYNGSPRYSGLVASRQKELARFLGG